MELDLVYNQASGCMYLCDQDDSRCLLARGYSGHGEHINKPVSQWLVAKGPIPRGVWKIGRPIHHQRLGPVSLPLTPFGHDACGRSEFFIHGDNSRGDRSASSGCIILPRSTREAIGALGLRCLTVE